MAQYSKDKYIFSRQNFVNIITVQWVISLFWVKFSFLFIIHYLTFDLLYDIMPQLLSVWSGCHGFVVHFLESVCILFHNVTLYIETICEDALVVKYCPNIHLILHFTSDCCSSDILQILFELLRIKQQIKFQGNALIKYEILVCLLHAWVKKYQIFFFTLKSLALYYTCSFMIGTF